MATVVQFPKAFEDLARPARYKAYHGGRGGAKSHSFAKRLLLDSGKERLRTLCAREVQASIKDSVKLLLDDQIELLGMGGHYRSLDTEIRGSNGSLFTFAGLGKMTSEQIKSYEGYDRVWVEEAHTISARSLEILIPTIRKPGSELWFSWNPRSAADPIDLRFRGPNPPPDAIIRKVCYFDNPFFPDTLEAERAYDEIHNRDRYGHIWLGEYEPVVVGAIWDRATLHQHRRTEDELPELARIVVSVDPAVGSEADSNEHGIIVCAEGQDGRGYVLADYSLRGSPAKWAKQVVAAFDRYEADYIIAETNQGGDMVEHTLQSVRRGLPVHQVKATRGKHVRAAPIASLYTFGKVSHVGTFNELEDQMCKITGAGYEGDGSPDRADALVWGLTFLFPQITAERPTEEYVEPEHSGGAQGWMAG